MMGLLQKAVETYDAMAHRAGVMYQEEKEPLALVSHIMVRGQIEITLDQDGNFVSARAMGKDDAKIIIPVTEESAGRTSAPCAHPLCDQLGYVAPYDETKLSLYLAALLDWEGSPYTHPKLRPIQNYVQGGTILADLSKAGIVQLDLDGRPADGKMMVCWTVNGLGEGSNGTCWEDKSLMQAFADYIAAKRSGSPPALCMVTGKMEASASQHPKGIVALNGNAKLISANDSSGFTYRGRFNSSDQAATVSYTASQKAHCTLRWLAANQGVSFGNRTFLCWNPQGIQVPKVTGAMGRKSGGSQRAADPTQYRQQLLESLSGWKHELPARAGVVIAAFDAATTGRLSVTYYNELLASDFLERLCVWEDTCKWENGPFGIQSPALFQIANLAFGALRNGKVESDSRILSQQMQRLIACRIDRIAFPIDIERNLVEKASNMLIYTGPKPEDTRKLRENLLFTACAVIRKYHFDYFKEEWDMALDKDCTDRSYLFGRLLAIAEAVERSTYSGENIRETNALRMQKVFALRPMATWRILEERLGPYYKQLNPGLRQYYRRITEEVADKLPLSATDLNRKLEDVYLLGYYHQRAYRKEKQESETEE